MKSMKKKRSIGKSNTLGSKKFSNNFHQNFVDLNPEYVDQDLILKNPDDFPDAIKDLQKQLGIDVGIGFKSGGLAGILEV